MGSLVLEFSFESLGIDQGRAIHQTKGEEVMGVYCQGTGSEAAEQKDNSIKNLSPNDPTIKALSQLSIDAEVPFHSIIGDQGIGNGEEGTDGVVTYKSAHLEGSESELIVPTGHGAHLHPLAILELKRILKLHLTLLPVLKTHPAR